MNCVSLVRTRWQVGFVIWAAAWAFSGCRWGSPEAGPSDPSAPATNPTLSFYEQRLLDVLTADQALVAEAFAESEGPLQVPQVRRRFQAISADYASIIADNPDEIDARLLYGKFLAQFGDRDGAHVQFSDVWRQDATIPVANQQIGAFLAEEGQYVDALGFYLRAVELAPAEAAYHYDLGELLATFRPGLVADGVLAEAQLERDMLAAFQQAAALAPDTLALQMRYGEAFYDVASPTWTLALAHWEKVAARHELSALEQDVVTLHRARVLVELGQTIDGVALAESVDRVALAASRDEILALAAGRE